jgi:valyl-tRNA synthetase
VLSEERMKSSRAFANKIWNAARFIFLQMERAGVDQLTLPSLDSAIAPAATWGRLQPAIEDRWIFHHLNEIAAKLDAAHANYRYHEAADLIWGFLWDDFCDWYVEVKKLRIQQGDPQGAHLTNLLRVFEYALRLLHPVMPFLTEELWQRLVARGPGIPETICLAAYPQANPAIADAEGASAFALLQEMVTAARALRADQKLDPKQQLEGVLYAASTELEVINALTNTKFIAAPLDAPREPGASRATPDFEVVLRLGGAQAEIMRTRLRKEIEQLDKVIASSQRQLGSEAFTSKAPPHVIEGIRTKLADYEAQRAKSQEALATLGS